MERKIDPRGRLNLGRQLLADLGLKAGGNVYVNFIEGGRALRVSASPMPEESDSRIEKSKLVSALVEALEHMREEENR